MLDLNGAWTAARHDCPVAGHDHLVSPPCDLVTAPVRAGLEAVDILRLRGGLGPVLRDRAGDTLGFLVPPGTAANWQLPGSASTETFGTDCAADGRPPVSGSAWLLPPAEAEHPAFRPDELRAALREAAHTLAALDRCR
jgi:hypothetical protein